MTEAELSAMEKKAVALAAKMDLGAMPDYETIREMSCNRLDLLAEVRELRGFLRTDDQNKIDVADLMRQIRRLRESNNHYLQMIAEANDLSSTPEAKGYLARLVEEAATLRESNKELVAALRPFAEIYKHIGGTWPKYMNISEFTFNGRSLTASVGDVRRAAAALEATEGRDGAAPTSTKE